MRAIGILTWAGLRGAVSVALALALPVTPEKATLLTACYGVVLFTMLVQGLSLSRPTRRLFPEESRDPDRG